MLAACGDDSPSGDAPSDSLPIDTVAPVDTTARPCHDGAARPSRAGSTIPTGADDVVVRIAYEGGFVPVEVAFLNLPTLLVTRRRSRLSCRVRLSRSIPARCCPTCRSRPVTEAGIQDLLALADDHGLLADVEYTNPTNIADAPDTVVEISANGETFVHRAYALGISDETDPARAALADFVAAGHRRLALRRQPGARP